MPAINAVKVSAEINSMALSVDATSAVTGSTTFTAASKQMSTQSYVPLTVGNPIRIDDTVSNNGLFGVTAAAPATQTVPPFLYTLDGPVVNESASSPLIRSLQQVVNHSGIFTIGLPSTNLEWVSPGWNPAVGDVMNVYYTAAAGPVSYVGTLTSVTPTTYNLTVNGQPSSLQAVIVTMNNFSGAPITFPKQTGNFGISTNAYGYQDPGPLLGKESVREVGPGLTDTLYNLWTDWYTAPLKDPDEIWIDISFPSGLAWYTSSGGAKPYSVSVQAQFRAIGASDAQATVNWTYTGSTQGFYRWTERVNVASLGLPAGTDYIQVRIQRTTAWQQDDATNQYISDTRWERLAAMHIMPPMQYENVTVVQLVLQNTRSAVSMGSTNSTFNCVAERILPSWSSASGWAAPAATERWADALVARMKATDGANKTDADIDLAGIYAIQAELDGQDGGDQGKISVTLDQMQDIDTELQIIASVARCSIYRIGRKLYATRDEGGKSAVALFTGRSKSPDGETVSLSMASDSDPDAVVVQWVDRANGWKVYEYQYPEAVTPVNPLQVTPPLANWACAWRRAVYEWNRIQLRRDSISFQATDEARLVHLGDVVNIADDVANLSQTAGEVVSVAADGLTLTVDHIFQIQSGGYSVLLRSQDGRSTDTIAATQGAAANELILARAPNFAIKGRDDGMGTIWAIYHHANSVVRPWLVTGLDPAPPYIRLSANNWRSDMFSGDSATLPPQPPESRAEPADAVSESA